MTCFFSATNLKHTFENVCLVSGFNPLEKYYSSNWVSSSPKFRSEHNSQVFWLATNQLDHVWWIGKNIPKSMDRMVVEVGGGGNHSLRTGFHHSIWCQTKVHKKLLFRIDMCKCNYDEHVCTIWIPISILAFTHLGAPCQSNIALDINGHPPFPIGNAGHLQKVYFSLPS